MTRETKPNDPVPDVSVVKMSLSFFAGILIGVGFVFQTFLLHSEWSLPAIGSFGSLETDLLVAVLLILATFLSFFLLYQFFILVDH